VLSSEELVQKDAQYVIRAWASIAEPTPVVEGRGAVLMDQEGREYIDCSSGLFAVNVGHSHPEVVAAIKDQVEKVIQVSVLQTTEPMVRLAERVAQLTPAPLQKSYFTTGGGESIEVALKMARQYTGKYEIIVLKNAFHGLGFGSGAATGATSYKRGFGPLLYGFLRAPHAYCYRCPFQLTFPACDLRCAQEIENIITDTAICTVADGSIGAVLVEPVQGRGGIIPPDDWLPRVREICDRHGVLLVLDEIQTGFGRTGKLFAFEHRGVVPDILVLSKNVGGGIPAGVVVPREEIAEDFRTGTTPTHSGNALACRAGLAALEVLVRERLWENAAWMGQRFKQGLESMRASRYVGEARFKGLMGGVELVQDQSTKEPLSREKVGRIKEALLRRSIITSASGPCGNVFRVQPPLVVTADQVDRVVSAFDEAIVEVMGV
jgi:4-aminobutyrate aminotransferase/(S)-3-amino-2-methylpropionate transaminase